MPSEPKPFDLATLKPLAGFAPVDASKLANTSLRLDRGRRLELPALERSFHVIDRAAGATEQLGRIPDPGEAVHCVLNGTFALFDFIPAILNLSGEPIDHLFVATLSFSRKNVDALADLMRDDLIRRAAILCSHYFSAQDREIYDHAAGLCSDRFTLAAMRTHAKVLLIAQADRRLVIESSANARSCHNVEQATVIHHGGLYDFHHEWMHTLMTKATEKPR